MKPISSLSLILLAGISAPALAAPPIPVGNGITLTPLVDARLRYEGVDQDGIAENATAVTARLRSGLEIGVAGGFSLLAEAEGTLAIIEDYNSLTNGRTAFPVVADPQNVELNRLQLQYKRPGVTLTAGRQRINIDDHRFVGNVGWRQNEQTFDAVRIEAQPVEPLKVDLAYVRGVRTIFGIEASDNPPASPTRQSIDGDNLFANAAVTFGPVTARGFAFLIDQDEIGRRQFSSQTYGASATVGILTSGPTRLSLSGWYAHQTDWQDNPNDYAADYWRVEATGQLAGFNLTAGHEVLGADDSPAFAFQTPLATLHKFNGWADKFLTTPANGLRDSYASVGRTLTDLGPFPDLNVAVAYHHFESDRLGLSYGDEWDAQLGFRIRRVGILAKFARYDRSGAANFLGDADTTKFWLQLEWAI